MTPRTQRQQIGGVAEQLERRDGEERADAAREVRDVDRFGTLLKNQAGSLGV